MNVLKTILFRNTVFKLWKVLLATRNHIINAKTYQWMMDRKFSTSFLLVCWKHTLNQLPGMKTWSNHTVQLFGQPVLRSACPWVSVGVRGCPWEGVAQTLVNVRSERRLGRKSNVLGSPGSWRRPWRGRLALEVGLWPSARSSMKTWFVYWLPFMIKMLIQKCTNCHFNIIKTQNLWTFLGNLTFVDFTNTFLLIYMVRNTLLYFSIWRMISFNL